jgi:hypothetical protein
MFDDLSTPSLSSSDLDHTSIKHVFAIQHRSPDNPTLTSALKHWSRWSIPSDKELDTIDELGCVEQVTRDQVPHGVQILPTKMDFKTKFDSLGEWLKDKARLVVLGNLELLQLFKDYYSPTAHSQTLHLLLALAAHFQMSLKGLDIYGAFLTADIDEPVYIQLPKGLPNKWGEGAIFRLHKTLYGLRRSPRAFYDSLSSYLLSIGYSKSKFDQCLFFKRFAPDHLLMFCIHVDDFAIASTHPQYADELISLLRQRYIVTQSDTLETFLGIHIESANSSLYLSQPGLINKIISESNLGDASPKSTPMVANYDEQLQDDSPSCDRSQYRRLLGMIMFLLRTRPDISYAVTRLATRTSTATEKDMSALLRVVRYLKGTSHMELVFSWSFTTYPLWLC